MTVDLVHSERDVLLRFLNKMRDAVVAATEGLDEEQVRAPGVPSGTNLLGIVQHLTGVERHWFRFVFLGEDVECNMTMDVPLAFSTADIVSAYRAACTKSDDIVYACDHLSTLAARPNPGEEPERDALRRIVTHMIEETGRHAGQADILRERIDGSTGL